eukprot:Gregarina_sp_Poly_1__10556@NODE_781_length_6314_cov_28_558028_g573_i0_p4_GENE_NODE_781_length_6314_cov_28_558028_g573_i0NODE_781_length_6314_cov_28_558028_g573_i0_p4_ORF_typecomplete_len203_score7_53zfRING_2/PF13639_6/4_2zfRING_2/PF13639_6/27zfRING_2/PF13639_6/4_9zfRING_2/PF13639_6/1_3e03zfRING_11/PF17123_5/6_2zfRING_11/PF17123_5/3_1e02zfRING_11/PF17123_5/31zfRING_11/PF17123_5/43zfRING_11/PF17123_5/1e04zfC3HC4_3/PF13920_6/1_3zfC3HC4_3/PF13920_6/2_3e02zfC3HC4_3/PF13920_6/1_5e03zfC3HC4_3/PF13920_6
MWNGENNSFVILPCDHKYRGKCHDLQYRRKKWTQCDEEITAQLECGHSVTGRCYFFSMVSMKCFERVSIVLPCGHRYEGECHEINVGIKCKKKRTQALACGKSVTATCHRINARLVKCRAKGSVILPCGHIRRGQCHQIRSQTSEFLCRLCLVIPANTHYPCHALFPLKPNRFHRAIFLYKTINSAAAIFAATSLFRELFYA